MEDFICNIVRCDLYQVEPACTVGLLLEMESLYKYIPAKYITKEDEMTIEEAKEKGIAERKLKELLEMEVPIFLDDEDKIEYRKVSEIDKLVEVINDVIDALHRDNTVKVSGDYRVVWNEVNVPIIWQDGINKYYYYDDDTSCHEDWEEEYGVLGGAVKLKCMYFCKYGYIENKEYIIERFYQCMLNMPKNKITGRLREIIEYIINCDCKGDEECKRTKLKALAELIFDQMYYEKELPPNTYHYSYPSTYLVIYGTAYEAPYIHCWSCTSIDGTSGGSCDENYTYYATKVNPTFKAVKAVLPVLAIEFNKCKY